MLAGLCSMEAACKPQGSVAESVAALKRVHYLLKQVSQCLVARIPAEPVYELKTLFGHHAYLLSAQVDRIRGRVAEMREPPLGLERIPDPALAWVMDEVASCRATMPTIHAIYSLVLPYVMREVHDLKARTHPLADAPTVRACRLIEWELEEVLSTGQETDQCLSALDEHQPGDFLFDRPDQTHVDAASRLVWDEWYASVQQALAIARSNRETDEEAEPDAVAIVKADAVDESGDAHSPNNPVDDGLPPRKFSQAAAGDDDVPARQFECRPCRDSRFSDPYNAGVNAEAFLYDPAFPARDKTLMMFFKRFRELDVPEVMASILVELSEQEPWEFYLEMVRQLWDETRHAMMGEVGFVSTGIDWTQIPVNHTWSMNLNTQLGPRERHGVLFFIEQGLMPKTGKRFEWEVAQQSGCALSAVFQDYDWADEVLHAQIGRRWFVPRFPHLNDALAYGDQCWTQVMSHWDAYKQQGLTQHRNWWPDIYQQACQFWDCAPDPRVLAYSQSYREMRADLQEIPRASDSDN